MLEAHWLSLDVVLGAILSNIVFWKLTNQQGSVNSLSTIALGVAVFAIYTIDRLMDLKNSQLNNTPRHFFHSKHKTILWEVSLVLSFFTIIYSFTLSLSLINYGVILSIMVLIYLFLVNKYPKNKYLQLFKEPTTGVIYWLGVVGVTLVKTEANLWQNNIAAVAFLLIVIQNLFLFSIYEAVDKPDAHNIANYIGKKAARNLNLILFLIIVLICAYTFANTNSIFLKKVLLIEMLMTAILWFLNDFIKFFIQNERYRWLGDGVFLFMAIPLLSN